MSRKKYPEGWKAHKEFWLRMVGPCCHVPDTALEELFKDPILRVLLAWRLQDRYGLSPLVIAGLLGRKNINYTLRQLEGARDHYISMWCGETGLVVYKPWKVRRKFDRPGGALIVSGPSYWSPDPWSAGKKAQAVKLMREVNLEELTDSQLRRWHRPGFYGSISLPRWKILKEAIAVGEVNGKVKKKTSPRGSKSA